MLISLKKTYRGFITLFVLIPNLFVIVVGIESFPFTCAPMFGHYINEDTNLYSFKFEGELNNNEVIDLIDYYGKPERSFIRHFFNEVYGSCKPISPFSSRLIETKEDFRLRMDTFFGHYNSFLSEEHNMSIKRIIFSLKKVDLDRNMVSNYQTVGFFDCSKEKYYSQLELNSQ